MKTARNATASLSKAFHVLLLAALIALPLAAQNNGAAQPVGIPTDWSHKHLIFTQGGSAQSQVDAQRDPRARLQWLRRNVPWFQQQLPPAVSNGDNSANAPDRTRKPPRSRLKRDWNFSLKTSSIDTGLVSYSYPAKYSFNPIGTANCTNDFLIYGLGVAGSSTQANLIGVNNLYVGPTGSPGICSNIASNGGNGSAPTPQVKWAYNVTQSTSTTGHIVSSVVLNLIGTKVAYVVVPSVVSSSAPLQFHVLTLGAATGTVNAPTAATCGTATLTCVNLSTTPGHLASISSPFVDYTNDIAWVGDDIGTLYKITGVFTGFPTLASTTTVGGSCVTTGGAGIMTPPVYDAAVNTVFFGCSDGNLYGYNASTLAQISGSPLTLAASQVLGALLTVAVRAGGGGTGYVTGDVVSVDGGSGGTVTVTASGGGVTGVTLTSAGFGYTTGTNLNPNTTTKITGSGTGLILTSSVSAAATDGIHAPPIVDSTNHVLYVFYGDNGAGGGSAAAEVAQVVYTSSPTFLATTTTVLTTAGTNKAAYATTAFGSYVMTAGDFSQSYFATFNSTTSFLYACGTRASSGSKQGVALDQFQFNASRILSSTVTNVNTISSSSTVPSGTALCSPVTEFLNVSTDRLFLSVPSLATSNFLSFDITSNTAGGALTSTAAATAPDGGTGGIIVDGADTSAQASSIYFTSLGGTGTCTTSSTANPANTGIGSVTPAVCAYKLTQSGLN